MAVFNSAKREIDIKIVYYGPALCGKTTNVQFVHQRLAPHQRGEMVSLATKDDRTLFFDFLPIELGNVKGFKTRFHIYTVPGQVYYGLTRRAVLTGVDGIVFVADSQRDKLAENLESLQDLEDNLQYYRKELSMLPFLMQYNKRDMDNILSVAELDAELNKLQVPFFEASALMGNGVMETLTACCRMVLQKMDESSAKKDGPIIKIFKEPVPEATSAPPEPAIAILGDEEEAVSVNEPVITLNDEEMPVCQSDAETLLQEPSIEASAGPALSEQTGVVTIIQPEDYTAVSEPVISLSPASEEPVFTLEELPPLERIQPEQSVIEKDDVSIQYACEPVPDSSPEYCRAEAFITETAPAAEHSIKIVTCGQPTVESSASIKLPVTFTIEPFSKQCKIDIVITFNNLIVKEPA